MSGRNSLRERAALLDELRQIVQAMKNLAFAELQRVTRILPIQAQARDAVLQALRAVGIAKPASDAPGPSPLPATWLVIGAERGFCGAFNATLWEEVGALRARDPQARVLVASRRLYELFGADPANAAVLGGCASTEDADARLDDWLAALSREGPKCSELWLLHASEAGTQRLRLLPEPQLPSGIASMAPPTHAGGAPMHYLPLPSLRAALVRQAGRLLIQAGLLASLREENRWRLSQMQRAQDHLDELGRALQRRYAGLRQADITNELETLMSSIDAHPG